MRAVRLIAIEDFRLSDGTAVQIGERIEVPGDEAHQQLIFDLIAGELAIETKASKAEREDEGREHRLHLARQQRRMLGSTY